MLKNVRFGSKGGIKTIIGNCIVGVGVPIKIWCYYKPKWRKLNQHNLTELNCCLSIDGMKKIKIGNYTYGSLDIRLGEFDNAFVKIGSYCSIAAEVVFLCGRDHSINHISTYPLGCHAFGYYENRDDTKNVLNIAKSRKEIRKLENNNKGPIIVDDDVRIGTGAKIMSGVHIGQGAVVAAGAVVTKDIPPYAIAGGVPAKVIKYRFSEDKIKKLLQIDYPNIPIEKFREIYPETIKKDLDIDYILKKLKE